MFNQPRSNDGKLKTAQATTPNKVRKNPNQNRRVAV